MNPSPHALTHRGRDTDSQKVPAESDQVGSFTM